MGREGSAIDRNTARFLGALGIAVGVGGLAYVGFEYYRRRAASGLAMALSAAPAPPGQVSQLTVNVTNSGSSSVRVGVQAAFVESGNIVGGHWFTSAQAAQAAVAAFQSGGNQAAAQYVSNPADRVAVVTVAPGQTVPVTLYSEVTGGPGAYPFIVWTEPDPIGLIVADTTGRAVTTPTGAKAQTGTLQVP